MSIPLLKSELKSNSKIIVLFLAVITLYAGIITAMYDPELGAGINELAKSMPQFFAVFGMKNPGTTLLDFLNNYLYGFILILIPFIYIILMCYKLVAKYIDKGSMAYLLNTHYSRTQIILTQFIVLLVGLLILICYATGLIIFVSNLMFTGEMEIAKFLLINLGLLVLEIFLSSLCFLFACLFNELKFSIGLGAGLGMVFFLIQMLSQVSDDIEFLKYFTPLTLFSPENIIKYDTGAFMCLGVLLISAVLFLIIAMEKFKKRDLSL
jgi:ABC-2 type transport system permease protein